jgi:hypothetical protein
MQVLEVCHTDFTLVIQCNNLDTTFNRAKKKQPDIFNATTYSVNEGVISIFNFETKKLEKLNGSKSPPIIFENKDYFIDFEFRNKYEIENPYIYTKSKDVAEKFLYREGIGLLSGTINFGNDLGKSNLILRYLKDHLIHEFNFEFEVFPTKLNYREDYKKIISDIEKEYPYLVLDFLKKTYTSFKSGNTPNTDLIWWQVFGGLYDDFLRSSKFILNKPHTRIIRETKYVKADRIQKWTPILEEEYSQYNTFPNKNYPTEYKRLSINTPENRFFKHAVLQTKKRYQKVKKFILDKFEDKLTHQFKNELSGIEKELNIISINPFFITIEDFKGIKQESLVLQKATGYSTIYKAWIMLNSGLKFLEGIQKIELKNIADLYQIWCFLEIKGIIQEILVKEKPDKVDLIDIQFDDFVLKIERGVKSKVTFFGKDGEAIELFHDFSKDISEIQNLKSYTVSQKPDIVLRITKSDLKENYVFTYLFDAKYRLASDDKEGSPDLPTEDSINQMHRYRDSIYFENKNKRRNWKSNEIIKNYFPEKEVIGGYILYPGDGTLDQFRDKKINPFYSSIDEVNIGAFPLKPNDNSNKTLLKDHLTTIIGLDTDSILNDVSPQKESAYESPNPFVLIGFVPTEDHMLCFTNSDTPFYFSGEKKPSKFGFRNLRYFAPYIKEKGVREYYEIVNYELIPRNMILNAPKGKSNDISERLVIRLGNKFNINNGKYFKISDGQIRGGFRYSSLKNIKTPKDNKIEVLKVS